MLPGLSTPLVPLVALGVLALGGLAFSTVATRAPALNEGLQVEGITGNARLGYLPAMYDYSDYLYQTAIGFIRADFVFPEGGDPTKGTVSGEDLERRYRSAEPYLNQSLQLDPTNAYVWLEYAKTLGALKSLEAADVALRNSWDLGPGMGNLSLRRTYAIKALRAIRDDPAAYADIRASDLSVLEQQYPDIAIRLGTD